MSVIKKILGGLIIGVGWMNGLGMILWAVFVQPILNIHRLAVNDLPMALTIIKCILVCIIGGLLIYWGTVFGTYLIATENKTE